MVQKNKKTMIKEKGKEICQRVLDTNDFSKMFVFEIFLWYNTKDYVYLLNPNLG